MTVGEMLGIKFLNGSDVADGALVDAKKVCQNTAKSERASRVLKEDRTADYIRFLEYGA